MDQTIHVETVWSEKSSGDEPDNESELVQLGSISPLTSSMCSPDPPSWMEWSQNPSRKTFQEQVTYLVQKG
ncbi:hypothetical protein P875_00042967 [Aspergillus parasiticus SU-1]|uniref:Uncharacterized protein n=1 Tax=Aspergillus parasiticus (strain ATCC 56775 / NRRL 5862 / SRRC 143 / SU-1) TaxID=1403190 RepID=A0A0F0I4A1_ASPPU|nr:hypothetical protein P875_00042967 [Aspergillus parasiticus SU-1]